MNRTQRREQERSKRNGHSNMPNLQNLSSSEKDLNNFLSSMPMDSIPSEQTLRDLEAKFKEVPQTADQPPTTLGSDHSSISKTRKKREDKFDKLQTDLLGMTATISIGVMTVGKRRENEKIIKDGEIVLQHAEKLSLRLTDLSKKYPPVYKALSTLTQGSVIGALLMEVGAMVSEIYDNHRADIQAVSHEHEEQLETR